MQQAISPDPQASAEAATQWYGPGGRAGVEPDRVMGAVGSEQRATPRGAALAYAAAVLRTRFLAL